jgi:hypothetical protein
LSSGVFLYENIDCIAPSRNGKSAADCDIHKLSQSAQ